MIAEIEMYGTDMPRRSLRVKPHERIFVSRLIKSIVFATCFTNTQNSYYNHYTTHTNPMPLLKINRLKNPTFIEHRGLNISAEQNAWLHSK